MTTNTEYERIRNGNKIIGYVPKVFKRKEESSPKEPGKECVYKISKEKFTEKSSVGFLIFCVVLLGYVVKDCHARWAKFVIGRWLKNVKKSMVLAPRDHGKSTILTVAYVIWRIILNPNIRILIVGSTAKSATKFLSAIKSHFEKNTALRNLFGDYVSREKWSDDEIIVSKRDKIGLKESTVTAVGMFGTIVSGHFDLVIGEDIVDFENSRTQAQRNKTWDWFFTVVYPTVETDELNPENNGELTLRGTRYHYDDFYGRALGEVPAFKPGFMEGCAIIDSCFTDAGETVALWPERKSVETLRQIERDSGSIIFALQYKNNAQLTKGRIFTPAYFMNFYKELPEDVVIVAGYDLAVQTKTESDYFAEAVVASDKKHNIYLIDVMRDRIKAPAQFEYLKSSHINKKWIKGGVESVAYQEALPQFLRDSTKVPVKSVGRTKDKVTRAYKIQPLFENGKFFMPEGRQFPDFVNEMCLFPDATHDDMFDALETAISLVYKGGDFEYFFMDEQGQVVEVPTEADANRRKLIVQDSGVEVLLPEEVLQDIYLSQAY
jgi:predicted phage terminase large subunit-like protein